MKIFPQILMLVAACAMAGCTNDETLASSENEEGQPISFSVGTEPAASLTRTTETFAGASFTVMADHTTDNGNTWATFMPQQTATKNGEVWTTQTNYYMPKTGKVRFYAYSSASYTGSRPAAGNAPSFSITDVRTAQDDLLTTTTDVNGGLVSEIPLTFSHAMASVWYSITSDSMEGTVNSVTISGISDSGTFTIGNGWSNLSSSQSYSISAVQASPTIVIPQSLSGKTVTLSFTPSGSSKPQTLTTTISNVTLSSGNCYELKLTITKYEILITVSITDWTGETYDTKTLYI